MSGQYVAPLRAAVVDLCDRGLPWWPRTAASLAGVAEHRARAWCRQLEDAGVLASCRRELVMAGPEYVRWREEVDVSRPVRAQARGVRDGGDDAAWYVRRARVRLAGAVAREARRRAGWTVRRLSEATGIDHSVLVRFERGQRGHTRWRELLADIEGVLGVIGTHVWLVALRSMSSEDVGWLGKGLRC